MKNAKIRSYSKNVTVLENVKRHPFCKENKQN